MPDAVQREQAIGAGRFPAGGRPHGPTQEAGAIAGAIEAFLEAHPEALLLEDGKVLFRLGTARCKVSAESGRCTVHLWSEERNLVRRVVEITDRGGMLRLATLRMGWAQPKLMELCTEQRAGLPTAREAARARYLKVLQRVLEREFGPWRAEGFRAAMDLERSFGPAYARGSLVRGREAWAVIGVGAEESAATIDGVLTLGVLWLEECRRRAGGRRLYKGLRVVVPEGMGALTHARLPWMNRAAAEWEMFELQGGEERLVQRDEADQGNVRTALVHRPDEGGARERFAAAVEAVRGLVPAEAWSGVEQELRSSAELVFLWHGFAFARAKVVVEERRFGHRVEVSVGAGPAEQLLTEHTCTEAAEHIAELCRRRRPPEVETDYGGRGRLGGTGRRIGSGVLGRAHRRTLRGERNGPDAVPRGQDPLFRAAPERWLESVLRADLAPLTRELGPAARYGRPALRGASSTGVDVETRGNREFSGGGGRAVNARAAAGSRLIPRLDPRHVYTQVPAIAGASDRGMLDLLGATEDGRLAVIELKTEDDLQFAMQGLDYWIRVRAHHAGSADRNGLGEFQRHGYFREVELSAEPPRLYLVAPSLHVHPATETVLRYLSPEVEWHLLALDERWRQAVRVVWRRSNRTG